jgi:hypothetical protein
VPGTRHPLHDRNPDLGIAGETHPCGSYQGREGVATAKAATPYRHVPVGQALPRIRFSFVPHTGQMP